MIWPVKDFWISDKYRPGHQAIDLASHGGKYGLPILAPVAGQVIEVGTNPNYFGGLYVIIRDSKGYEHYTGHHQRIRVSQGQTVKQGQRIADMGATGQATGPHTHYQIRNPQKKLISPNVLYANRNKNKGEKMLTNHGQNLLYRVYLGKEVPSSARSRVGKVTFDAESKRIRGLKEFQTRVNRAKNATLDVDAHLVSSLRTHKPAEKKLSTLATELKKARKDLAKAEQDIDTIIDQHNFNFVELEEALERAEKAEKEVARLDQGTEGLNRLGEVLMIIVNKIGRD